MERLALCRVYVCPRRSIHRIASQRRVSFRNSCVESCVTLQSAPWTDYSRSIDAHAPSVPMFEGFTSFVDTWTPLDSECSEAHLSA